jgi:hypothetical protein
MKSVNTDPILDTNIMKTSQHPADLFVLRDIFDVEITVTGILIHAHSRRSDISRSIGTLDGASCSTDVSLDREGMADLQLVVTIGKFKVGVYAG